MTFALAICWRELAARGVTNRRAPYLCQNREDHTHDTLHRPD